VRKRVQGREGPRKRRTQGQMVGVAGATCCGNPRDHARTAQLAGSKIALLAEAEAEGAGDTRVRSGEVAPSMEEAEQEQVAG
jgi:hypothetical protein